MPLILEPLALLFVRDAQGLQQDGRGRVTPEAEGEAQRERPRGGKVELAHDGHVPVEGPVELPVHAEIPPEIGPAVARADEPAGGAREGDRGPERQVYLAAAGGQHVPARDAHLERAVAPTPALEMRSEQDVEPQLLQERLVAFQAGVNQDAGQMRVGDDLLDDAIALPRVRVDQAVAEGVIVQVFQPGLQIALLLVEEALAVRDEVAEVPDLGRVDGGEVDLVEDAVREGEPHAAGGAVGRAHPLLAAARPARRYPRASERVFLRRLHRSTHRRAARRPPAPPSSGSGLCQPPSAAIRASASFGPQLPRL